MIKRPLRYFVLTVMLVILTLILAETPAGAQTNSTIRVWLRRLRIEDTLRINIQGTYA